MAQAGKIRIAEEIVIEWLDRPAGATCPNCGRTGEVTQCLDIDFRPPDRPHRFILQICPACTVRFVDNTHSMDYGHEDVVELGWQAYQVQQGAGIWPIVGPLMRIPRGPGARVLEIGGGYGFGLDFCVRARGWRGEGYDPSLLSAFGRDELGLTVHQGYFGPENLRDGPWDVLIATEVIEHVVIPPEFLRLARAALGETGILLLTTPDAAWIAPDTSADRLLPLLSPGVHVVLQTQASLTQALHAAGFAHVQVAREGTSLIAYAAAAPFTLLDDAAATRAAYRTYLIERALIAPPGSDLQLGFAGRGLFEAANDGDAAGAEAAWAALLPAVQARFGLDLESVAALPAGAAAATLAALVTLMPLNLGMVCFARAMQLLAAGVPRAGVERLLRLAGAAVAALQAALAKRSITDALYVVLGPLIEDELLIGEAEAGAPGCVAPLAARGGALAWRGFVGLVNAAAYGPASALREAAGLDAPEAALDPGLRRDAWLSLANLGLAPGGDIGLAIAAGEALGPPGAPIVGQAFIRLVNAGRYDEAAALAAARDLRAETAGLPMAADLRRAELSLALNTGDPAQVPALVAAAALAPAAALALCLGAFTRLVGAGRLEAAAALLTPEFAADLDAATGAEADSARLAAVLLDLGLGRTEVAMQRLVALREAGVPAATLGPLAVEGFVRLVNEGRDEAATALWPAFGDWLSACAPALRDDALSARFMLALRGGEDPSIALDAAAAGGLTTARSTALALAGLVALVNRADYAGARRLLARAEPALIRAAPPLDDATASGLFAAGLLFLQDKRDWRRAAALLARLRDGLIRRAPAGGPADPLFWPALRAEIIALNGLARGAEATGLLKSFIPVYPACPEDLLAQVAAVG